MIDLEAGFHRLGGIILPLDQLPAALVAHALRLGGHRRHMVAGAAVRADPAAAHALHNRLVADLQGDHAVEDDPGLLQGLGLGDGAGHAVQNVTLGTVRLFQPLGNDADDDLIGHQLPRVHEGLGLQARGSAVLHGGAEDVAGGDGGNIQLFTQDVGLCSLSGARGAQQD